MKNRKNNGYPWPASQLGTEEMEILTRWRTELKLPITELIRQSVIECDRIIKGRAGCGHIRKAA